VARVAALLCLLSLAGLSSARAQEPIPCAEGDEEEGASEPSEAASVELDENEEQARRLFLLGDDLYMQGRYEEALAAFEESYELSGRPLLLYNMANVHERSGDFEQALLKLEAYLPESTDEERPRLRTRIESLRDRIERLEERRRLEEERLRMQQAGMQRPARSPLDVPALLTTLGGVVILGGAVGLAVLARNTGDTLEAGCSTTASGTYCPDSLEGDIKRERRAAFAADGLFVAGVAAIGVGIFLFLRDDDQEEDEPDAGPQVDGWLGPQGGGMQVSGAF
jgi:tetratricopeptide (TPR) repeat protein